MAEGPSSQKRMKVEAPQSSSPSSSHGFQSSFRVHHHLLHAVEPASMVALFPSSSNGPVTGEVDRNPSIRASEQVFDSVDTSYGARDPPVSERNGILHETSIDPNIREDLVIEQLTNVRNPGYGPSVSEGNVILQVNSDSARGESVQTLANSSHGARDLDGSERNIVSQEISASVSANPTVREDSVAEQTGVALDYSHVARDLGVSEINGILQTTSASVREEQVQVSTGQLEAVNEAIISSSVQPVVINIEDIDYQEPADPGKSPGASREKDSMDNTDSMTCPICMESWTSEGSHRIWDLSSPIPALISRRNLIRFISRKNLIRQLDGILLQLFHWLHAGIIIPFSLVFGQTWYPLYKGYTKLDVYIQRQTVHVALVNP